MIYCYLLAQSVCVSVRFSLFIDAKGEKIEGVGGNILLVACWKLIGPWHMIKCFKLY